jgi:hypothetical protein
MAVYSDSNIENMPPEKQAVLHSVFVLLIKYYSGDQIKEDGIGGACGTYGEG